MFQIAFLFLLVGWVTPENEVAITFEPGEEFDEAIEATHTTEAMFSDDVKVEVARERRQSSTQCTDDPTASFSVTEKSTGTRYTGLSCVAFFLKTGIAFCGNDELKQKCCATRHRHCEHCPDTKGVKISGYTCDEYFQLTGARSCANDQLRRYCCGTRRRYCETCYQDTTGIRINDMTCQEILSKGDKAQLCDHHLIKQHCCASVAHFCPCKADVPAALFTHNEAKGNVADCANIFKVGNLADQCKHPNLWEKCCKTRQNFCSVPPETTLIGR